MIFIILLLYPYFASLPFFPFLEKFGPGVVLIVYALFHRRSGGGGGGSGGGRRLPSVQTLVVVLAGCVGSALACALYLRPGVSTAPLPANYCPPRHTWLFCSSVVLTSHPRHTLVVPSLIKMIFFLIFILF